MNIGQTIALLSLIAKLLPTVVELVKALDVVQEGAGTGPEKMNLVLEVLKNSVDGLKDVDWTAVEPILRKVVERVLVLVRR